MPSIEPDICKKIFLTIHRKIGSNQTSNAKKYIPKLLHIRSSTSNTSTYTSDSESCRNVTIFDGLIYISKGTCIFKGTITEIKVVVCIKI